MLCRQNVLVSLGRTHGWGGDVREIGRNAGGVDDIVEGELINVRAGLEEERERLVRDTAVSS